KQSEYRLSIVAADRRGEHPADRVTFVPQLGIRRRGRQQPTGRVELVRRHGVAGTLLDDVAERVPGELHALARTVDPGDQLSRLVVLVAQFAAVEVDLDRKSTRLN